MLKAQDNLTQHEKDFKSVFSLSRLCLSDLLECLTFKESAH